MGCGSLTNWSIKNLNRYMQSPNLIRFEQRFESLSKAYKLLSSAVKKSEFNDLEKAGLSQTLVIFGLKFWIIAICLVIDIRFKSL
jgi:hypothetical protein